MVNFCCFYSYDRVVFAERKRLFKFSKFLSSLRRYFIFNHYRKRAFVYINPTNSEFTLSEIFKKDAFSLNLSQKIRNEFFPYTINLCEIREEDALLYEPICSGKVVSCSLISILWTIIGGLNINLIIRYRNFN